MRKILPMLALLSLVGCSKEDLESDIVSDVKNRLVISYSLDEVHRIVILDNEKLYGRGDTLTFYYDGAYNLDSLGDVVAIVREINYRSIE